MRLRRAIICCKHREFQYKLLHGALYTKEHLYRFGFVPDNLCSFCGKEGETYPHLFLFCENIQKSWKEIIDKLKLWEIDISNWNLIFMGLQGNSNRIKVCNSIIIIMKYVIYSSRTKGVLPSINNILRTIENYKDQEKALAIKIGKLGLHLNKWDHLAS